MVLHEIGHAVLHREKDRGTFGREETEADNFASVVLLRSLGQREELVESLLALHSFLSAAFTWTGQPDARRYADEHELEPQRYSNYACLLAGRSPDLSRSLVEQQALTKARAGRCGGGIASSAYRNE